jgi:catechol 2,3-dioxygenase-like lactoylglutathione lyase family enzyme
MRMQQNTGLIHHLSIHVSDLKDSTSFWGWFLGQLGYAQSDSWKDGVSYQLGATYIDIIQVEDEYRAVPHDRERVGMHHLAFHASSREHVDQMTYEIRSRGLTVLYPDQHPFAGGQNYYALYFEDPNGIKVELVAPT